MITAGIGSRECVELREVVAIVRRAAGLAGRDPALLAIPWFRDGPALRSAADLLRLPVRVVSREEIVGTEARCRTHSERARAVHGISSVAEGCALAACGEDAVLLLPRIAIGGLTCALAVAGQSGTRR